MSGEINYYSDHIHMDKIARLYGYSSYIDLLGNKRYLGRLQWTAFAGISDWLIRKDIADRFVEAEIPGTRALPVGEAECGSGKTCCNSKSPDSLYCFADARRALIFDYLKQGDNNERGLSVIEFVTHFIYYRGVPCLLRDEASMRLELFELVRAGYLIRTEDSARLCKYRMNPIPQPTRRSPGRPFGS
ncbi:unannotated protein [freshwater metagenome]|uniref:Unannotated protein n=1 Tax=freshwater metagenome TaxID=449393 RepID=A0A6J6WDP5_9ZZZZ|nr:hypothetical protein [Actinomycetota bacterium]MSW26953.1 hypothetical protein [Actinomycetota bacterium]MSX51974.1 hypothetical protein [Actinomycetota bacterium]MSZ74985.1 hypothetical protein [Actinomycetota bacterium]